jgi:glycosyltransferase involved in cell wall biosynthesis
MIIAYDVSHIRQHRAGIGRLATMQLQGLLAADQKRSYLLHGWAPDLDTEKIRAFYQANVRYSIARMPGIVRRIYWNRLRMPPLEWLIGPFDVFHSAEPLLPPVGKRKAIISFNDSAYYKFPQFYSPGTAQKWDYLYRRSLQLADAIIVLSESTRNDLIDMMALPPERIHIVRPPTDPIFSNTRSQLEETELRKRMSLPEEFVLYVGTIEPRKNIPRLVKAFEMFLESARRPVSLVVVGRLGWLYEDILAAIESSPARPNIRRLDYIADADLAVLYRMASMFVFPSHYEGHGYPVVEAMASGTPVITSNNSSLREIGEGAAILVDSENVGEICRAMQHLEKEHSLRQELVTSGLERAARFSVKNAVDAILDLYDLLERRPPRAG